MLKTQILQYKFKLLTDIACGISATNENIKGMKQGYTESYFSGYCHKSKRLPINL